MSKIAKKILISTQYRHPLSKGKIFEEYVTIVTTKSKQEISQPIVGDLNLNPLDYNVNAKVKTHENLLFRNSYIQLISKPTRNSKMNATIFDHINTNNFLETDIKQEY